MVSGVQDYIFQNLTYLDASIISTCVDKPSMAVGSERAEESNTSVLTPTEEGLPLLYQAGTYQHKPDRSRTTTLLVGRMHLPCDGTWFEDDEFCVDTSSPPW